ncbi:acyl-[ACP]--phospholipid O-acyltransferase [Pokkaliibacter sp. CJK22405]|uniref:acyl-[ACP]--phospholipid O-acyltransferase n=1 Tax=Pokkaliibacter sp. CJK22405 TaxID=3384615 RepID=UPI0039855AF7
MLALRRIQGAFPFLIAVFLNAFTDLGHKIIIQNTVFKIYDGREQIMLTAIVNALILLPFILFFIPAGNSSDNLPKDKVMRRCGWAAVVLTLGITLCYYLGWFWPAFLMTFLMAVQSAWYSPAKFGYLKAMFGKEHLAEANGRVQAISILAILAGTFAFSILFELRYDTSAMSPNEVVSHLAPLGWALVLCAVFELAMLYRVPQLEEASKEPVANSLLHSFNPTLLGKQLQPVMRSRAIRLSILGLAVFWSVGQVMLAAFPAFAKATTEIDNTIVIQGILASSGIGIAIGSALAARFSRNYIELGLIPLGAAGIAAGLLLLPSLTTPMTFTADFLFIGLMGGLFIVPLNALIQFHAGEHELGRVIAGNNLFQNIAMVMFLGITVLFSLAGIDGQALLVLIAFIALIGGLYTVARLPQSLVRFVLSRILAQRYRIEVQGMKNIPEKGGVLLLGNHISWIDWAVIQTACPRPVRFVMERSIYDRWYLTWFFRAFGCVPIDAGAGSKSALKAVTQLLNEGEVVCVFPEGAISRNGHLGTFRQGFERACKDVTEPAAIIPFYLRGLWGSQFSRSSAHVRATRRSGRYRELIVAFGGRMDVSSSASEVKKRVFDLSISSWQTHVDELPSLPRAWMEGISLLRWRPALHDADGRQTSAWRSLTGAICLSRRVRNMEGDNIGMLLPTASAAMVANMSVLLAGKTLVCLNYTASVSALKAAVESANIKTICTSPRFLKKLEQRGIDLSEVFADVTVVELESVGKTIRKPEAIATLAMVVLLPVRLLNRLVNRSRDPQQTAVVLFSSGSEGKPKGVCLTHANIMANVKQVSDVLNTRQRDVILASLPLFHAFGLTVTQFLAMIEGIPVVCCPDPTDAAAVAKAVARFRVTIMCGTSTFFRIYSRAKRVHPMMLESLRIVVAGAERLDPAVRKAFTLRFNKEVLEGYGATETTPVAAVNLPDALDTRYWTVQLGHKEGTVGMPLPGTSVRIVDPETLESMPTGEDGMILIGGPQVMQGYLNDPERTDKVIRIMDGIRWYITGDKGHIDEDGFLTVVDRYSRFAKVGGEMVSLGAVEEAVNKVLGDEVRVMAVAVPDERKGEDIVLLSEEDVTLESLRKGMKDQQVSALLVPAKVLQVEKLPVLGTGKADLAGAKKLAISLLEGGDETGAKASAADANANGSDSSRRDSSGSDESESHKAAEYKDRSDS